MTNELIAKAKECKNTEELLALAKENGIEMTEEQAAARFAQLNVEGEISETELDNVSGGSCHTKVDGVKYVVTTNYEKCFTGYYVPWKGDEGDNFKRHLWAGTMPPDGEKRCGTCTYLRFDGGIGYCGKSAK